ncbi:MAG: hypothetical protein QF893_01320 [Alphaproteobacteria bacterium]|jgi:hypothetical protein|nr:hypothetical protein [Alphaproteobacteria bacterium]
MARQTSRPARKKAAPADETADAIATTVMKLIADGKIKGLPRRGYVVKRGRGRVIVSLVNS